MNRIYINHYINNEIVVDKNGDTTSITPWTVSTFFKEADQIVSKNVLQLMTTMEVNACLIDWFDSLNIGGELLLELPDVNFHMQNWMNAEWNENTLKDSSSLARISFKSIFGTQDTSNPMFENYNPLCNEVFKSGYNVKRLTFLLQRVGFANVGVKAENGILSAKATKTMSRGERQISPDYKSIRRDHRNRYEFACEQLQVLPSEPKILDLACGIGYGSLMLSNSTQGLVTGVDIDEGAIQYAKTHYGDTKVNYICADAKTVNLMQDQFNAITSFETIEHVDFAQLLVDKFYSLLKKNGVLICSTPNEDVMPYDSDKFKYHVKHYTVSELINLLSSAGFKNIELYTQHDPMHGEVVEGQDGSFIIAVAIK